MEGEECRRLPLCELGPVRSPPQLRPRRRLHVPGSRLVSESLVSLPVWVHSSPRPRPVGEGYTFTSNVSETRVRHPTRDARDHGSEGPYRSGHPVWAETCVYDGAGGSQGSCPVSYTTGSVGDVHCHRSFGVGPDLRPSREPVTLGLSPLGSVHVLSLRVSRCHRRIPVRLASTLDVGPDRLRS